MCTLPLVVADRSHQHNAPEACSQNLRLFALTDSDLPRPAPSLQAGTAVVSYRPTARPCAPTVAYQRVRDATAALATPEVRLYTKRIRFDAARRQWDRNRRHARWVGGGRVGPPRRGGASLSPGGTGGGGRLSAGERHPAPAQRRAMRSQDTGPDSRTPDLSGGRLAPGDPPHRSIPFTPA